MTYLRRCLATWLGLVALSTPPLTAQNPSPCSAPEFRQFDFWIGTWDVTSNGNEAGSNVIEAKLGGCVLHEHWTGASGNVGESFNTYDRTTGQWHQTWVDNAGSLLQLDGQFTEGAMQLQGTTRGPDGGEVLQRITWRQVDGDPDHVRQLWESSTDGGTTWTVAFDGHYRRRS